MNIYYTQDGIETGAIRRTIGCGERHIWHLISVIGLERASIDQVWKGYQSDANYNNPEGLASL